MVDDGGSTFAQEEHEGPHREAPEEIADDDADEVRLTEELELRDAVMLTEVESWRVEVVELVVVVAEVVVVSSSSLYVGVPSGSIMIVMSGSVQPGGNTMEPGG